MADNLPETMFVRNSIERIDTLDTRRGRIQRCFFFKMITVLKFNLYKDENHYDISNDASSSYLFLWKTNEISLLQDVYLRRRRRWVRVPEGRSRTGPPSV